MLDKWGNTKMNNIVEGIVLLILAGYFLIGALQLVTAARIKRTAGAISFPKKDFFVSVIIPVKGVSKKTKENLKSVCIQDYPRYEVIVVAEREEHGAYKAALALKRRYPHVKALISGLHDPKKSIAKCHNLIYAEKNAKGEVLLFGDSDVTYSKNWIRKMTEPLGEVVMGRKIDAATAPFFIEPEGFWGKLIALSISFVTFTTAFTQEGQRFPPYASGASISLSRNLFHRLEISKIWGSSANDDLVLANTLIDHGYTIYNQHGHLNHPNEVFFGFNQIMNKLIRWVVTISNFGHRRLKEQNPYLIAKNLQFQVSLVLGVLLYILGFSAVFALIIIGSGYLYSVLNRWAVGMIIEEKGMGHYYLLAPAMGLILIFFYLFVKTFYRSFSWEGERYSVN